MWEIGGSYHVLLLVEDMHWVLVHNWVCMVHFRNLDWHREELNTLVLDLVDQLVVHKVDWDRDCMDWVDSSWVVGCNSFCKNYV